MDDINVRDEILSHYTTEGSNAERLLDAQSTDSLVSMVHLCAGDEDQGGDDGVEEEFDDEDIANAINDWWYKHCQ